MKIITVSVNINTPDFNYGAMLHSWAFQQFLLKRDDVKKTEVLNYVMPSLEKTHRKLVFIDVFKQKGLCRAGKFLIADYIFYLIRLFKFNLFVKKNLLVTRKQYTQRDLDLVNLDFDSVIIESDVIWNPRLNNMKFDKTFFANNDSFLKMKKIAYSPSIGDNLVNDEFEREFSSLVKDINYISCRESYAKNIIEKLSGKKVEHVLDPVFLIDKNDYENIVHKRLIKEDYLLLYLPVNDNQKLREAARLYAKEHNLKIIEISTHLHKRSNGTKVYSVAGIEEFLSAIKYSNCIFTNSFHAVCFSLIYEKEFYAFSRKYPKKVEDICKIMGLENRYFKDDCFIECDKINYEEVRKIINMHRERSINWLNNALQNSEKKTC